MSDDPHRNMLAVQGPQLDWAYLDRWSAAHGTAELLAEIRASIPPVQDTTARPDDLIHHRRWDADREILEHTGYAVAPVTHALIATLPAAHAGEAVLTTQGQLFCGRAEDLKQSLAVGDVAFHAGRLGGALPQIAG